MMRVPEGSSPAIASRVAHWLLHGPAQVASGPHAGGVAGTLDADLTPRYAYPEDTGYYLQWLCWYATITGSATELVPRAVAAHRWLETWLALPQPLTRIYLHGPFEDWRNRTRFTFDCAMALRGLGSAAAAGLVQTERAVVSGLCAELRKTIARDGCFDACVHGPHLDLPERWSTRRGGFLAKAAAGVIRAADALPDIAPDVLAAARATFDAALQWSAQSPHDDAHPLLYTFEGILSVPEHPLHEQSVGMIVDHYLALLRHEELTGRIPERLSGAAGPQRADVLAQSIRIGDLLIGRVDAITADRLAPLRRRLADAIRADGSVLFALDDPHTLPNVWAAMFASQALAGMAAAPGTAPLIV